MWALQYIKNNKQAAPPPLPHVFLCNNYVNDTPPPALPTNVPESKYHVKLFLNRKDCHCETVFKNHGTPIVTTWDAEAGKVSVQHGSESQLQKGPTVPGCSQPHSPEEQTIPSSVGATLCLPIAAWNAQSMPAFHCFQWKLISSHQLFSLSFLLINLLLFSLFDPPVFWKSGQKRTVLVNSMWEMFYQLPAVTANAAWEACSGKKRA